MKLNWYFVLGVYNKIVYEYLRTEVNNEMANSQRYNVSEYWILASNADPCPVRDNSVQFILN